MSKKILKIQESNNELDIEINTGLNRVAETKVLVGVSRKVWFKDGHRGNNHFLIEAGPENMQSRNSEAKCICLCT